MAGLMDWLGLGSGGEEAPAPDTTPLPSGFSLDPPFKDPLPGVLPEAGNVGADTAAPGAPETQPAAPETGEPAAPPPRGFTLEAAALPPQNVAPSAPPDPNDLIGSIAQQYGVDPTTMRAFSQIESSNNPNARNGSHKGQFQLSDDEFEKYGGPGFGTGDIYDPVANTTAAAAKIKAEGAAFTQKFGRAPTPAEQYLIHQQGEAGAEAHWANPDAPAWESMHSTGEGQSKGPNWSKRAIWGNIPDDMKPLFGSVGNVSSKAFADLQAQRVAQASGSAPSDPEAIMRLPEEQRPAALRAAVNQELGQVGAAPINPPAPAAPAAQTPIPQGFSLEPPASAQAAAPAPDSAMPDGFTLEPPAAAVPQVAPAAKPEDTVPPPKAPEPGWFDTIKGAGKAGYYSVMSDIDKVVHPTSDIEQIPIEQPDDTPAGKLGAQSAAEGWKNPKWWAYQFVKGGTYAAPAILTAPIAAEAAGTAGVAALTGGYFGLTRMGAAYQEARIDGLSHDEAVERAMAQTTIATATGATMAVAPEVSLFGKVGSPGFEAMKRPISEALAQIFLVQPTIGAAGQIADAKAAGREATAGELATGYASNAAMGGGFQIGHMLFNDAKATVSGRPRGTRAASDEPIAEEGGPLSSVDVTPKPLPPPDGFTVAEPAPPAPPSGGGGAQTVDRPTVDRPTAEPIEDLIAQAKDVADPKSPRQALWLPYASLKNVLDSNRAADVLNAGGAAAEPDFDEQGGTLLAKNQGIIDQAKARRDAGENLQTIIGSLTGSGSGKPANGTHMVQQVNSDGAVTRESLVTPETQAATEKAFQRPGHEVRTVTLDEALQRRAEGLKPSPENAPVAKRSSSPRASGTTSKPVQSDVEPAEAGGEVSAPAKAETGSEPVTSFKTAKGSTYEVQPSGTTIRTKAARADVGHEGDEGEKEESAKTFYVSKENSQRLAPPDDVKWRLVDHGDGTVSMATQRADGKWGISPSSRKVPITDTPAKGSLPLEAWKPETINNVPAYGKIHLGNAITEVGKPGATRARSAAEAPGAEGVNPKHTGESAVATHEYTPAQGEANNRQLGHMKWNGLDLSIETDKDNVRKGVGKSGKPYEQKFPAGTRYGYIKGTMGNDNMHVDVHVGPHAKDEKLPVYVIDENDKTTGAFRQHKAMIGFDSEKEARETYTGTQGKSAKNIGAVTQMKPDQFKDWLAEGKRTEPATKAELAKELANEGAPSVFGSPPYEDVLEHLGENEDGETDIAALQDLLRERFGKVTWADLTDAERILAWEEITGDTFDPSRFNIENSLEDREAAARAEMETTEWKKSATARPETDTSLVEGYGTPEWEESRVYVDAEGNDIHGVDDALDYLRDTAVDKIPGGLKTEHRAIVILGLPGAGKTTICDALSESFGAAHLTADDARLIIPEYDEGRNAEGTLTEGSNLIQVVANNMAQAGENFIIETVGSSEAKVSGRGKILSAAGVKPMILFIDTPKAIAMERAVSRFKETGRAVPAELYDKLNPGDLYERAKKDGIFEDAAHIVWDEEASNWKVSEASPGFQEFRANFEQTSLREPGEGGRHIGEGDEERVPGGPGQQLGAAKPKAAAKPKSATAQLSAYVKRLVGKDKKAWTRAAPKLETLIAQVEADRKGETPATKATKASLERLGLRKAKIEDAGEKIGGARKDAYYKEHGLSVEDLSGMTGAEVASKVKKENVFPRPDYADLTANNVDPRAAYMIKLMYDRLPVKPGKAMVSTGEGNWRKLGLATPEDYITALKALRGVMADVKTVDDAKAVNSNFNRAIEALVDVDRVEPITTSIHKPVGKRAYSFKNPLPISWADERKATREVTNGWPGLEEWNKYFTISQSSYGNKDWSIDTKRTTPQPLYAALIKGHATENAYATREEAVAYAKSLIEKHKGELETGKEKTKAGEPKRPHLDKLERTGPDYRKGEHVTSQDYIDTFGFRGVEFGNWVAGDERQKVVNLGFDALHDLARVLGIPPNALSLDGKLSLAFGARGRGGKAAAHYEPDRLVVNMTKLSGAGSLAHEWGHAIDHYLGEAHADDPYAGAPKGASGWYKPGPFDRAGREIDNMPPRLRKAVKDLMRTIFYRKESDAEVVTRVTKKLADAERSLQAWQSHLGYLQANRKSRAEIRKGQDAITYWQRAVDNLRGNLDSVRRQDIESSYFKDAKKLSGKTGVDGYWARPTELFARSFEAYVYDKLAAADHLSQYLVQGVEPERYADTKFKGNPYPVGTERTAIDKAYDRLWKAMRAEGSKLVALEGEPEEEPANELSDFVDVKALTSLEKLGQLTEEMGALEQATEKASTPLEAARDRLLEDGFKTIVEARSFLKKHKFEGTAKEADELIERAVVQAARDIVASHDPKEAYNELVGLYDKQPNLSQRTSESVTMQAYSTPVPLAFIASRLAGIANAKKVFEPTAGHGALLIETKPGQDVWANELDPARAAALREDFPDLTNVTKRDATDYPMREPMYRKTDVVIANPPFGAMREGGKSKEFRIVLRGPGAVGSETAKLSDPWMTTAMDQAIAFHSLEAMADDGRAVLLLGGVKGETIEERRAGYRGQAKREFYWRLYNNYNVVDHFTVAGDLWQKQGAAWPVDVIVIHGRGKSGMALPAAVAPTTYGSWDALAEKLDVRAPQPGTEQGDRQAGGATRGGGRSGGGDGRSGGAVGGERGSKSVGGSEDNTGGVRSTGGEGQPADDAAPAGDTAEGGTALPVRDGGGTDTVSPPIVGQPKLTKQANAAGQALYKPQSKTEGIGSLVPVNMADAVTDALKRIEAKHGSIDDYVTDKLDYKSGTLGKHFSAEQVDALAMAIDNVEKGSGFILGDQTGIGKGRVVAGMLRYAMLHDMVPVFLTKEPKLYGDMFGDMKDIGIPEMLGRDPNVLITNAGEAVPLDEAALNHLNDYDEWRSRRAEAEEAGTKFDEKQPKRAGKFLSMGKAKIDAGMKALLETVKNPGKRLPEKMPHDMVFTTYSQMDSVRGKDTDRRKFLEAIAPRAMIVLDEAHEAGGSGVAQRGPGKNKDGTDKARPRSKFIRDVVKVAKGVVYSSATYAKRPDVMDLYARTDMGKAVDSPELLPALIQRGGVPMQQVVASMLAEAGQYLRRERSFEGVSYEVEAVPVNNAAYEQFSGSVRQIFDFDLAVKDEREQLMQQALDEAGSVKIRDAAVGEAAASSTSFAAIMHNIVSQMLLAIKADATADRAIAALKAGEKPIIGLSNTMESFVKDYADQEGLKSGDVMDLDFGAVLNRYLSRTLRITVKDADEGKVSHIQIPVSKLSAGLREMYQSAAQSIEQGNYEGMPVSPIDWLRYRLEQAGYTAAELTGRQMMVDYAGDRRQGTLAGMRPAPVVKPRSKGEMGAAGKSRSINAFNEGKLDAVILNRSGATGVSMHASAKFKDQRMRRMLLVQAEPNIDTHMQMLGRIHRTGQVRLPAYSQIAADIPAEARPTAVLMKKMASLNANTTASRKSVFMSEAVDFINEIGDKIVGDALKDDPRLNARLGWPLRTDADGKIPPESYVEIARKATGRLVLLPPKEQADFLDRVQSAYKDEIDRLNQVGENPLEAKSIDLQARPVNETILKPRIGNSDSPFLGAVDLETVSAKAQGRAMAPESIARLVAEAIPNGANSEGDPARVLQTLASQGRALMQERGRDLAMRFNTFSETVPQGEAGKLKKALDEDWARWQQTAAIAYPGAIVRLSGMAIGDFDGVVLKVHHPGKAKNPAALGAWRVDVAIPDTARMLSLPMSMLYPPGVDRGEDPGADLAPSYVRPEALLPKFEAARKEGRENRNIITGNVLSGFESTKGKGQIVNYTTESGETRPGILMPRDFSPEKFIAERSIRLLTGEQVAKFLDKVGNGVEVKSPTGDITLSKSNGAYYVDLPAGRGTGGKFYTDAEVRKTAFFEKRGNRMMARVMNRGDFVHVVDAMKKLGALFETDKQQDVAQGIATAGKMALNAERLPWPVLKASTGPMFMRSRLQKAIDNRQPVSLKNSASRIRAELVKQPNIFPAEVRESVLESMTPIGPGDDYTMVARDLQGQDLEFFATGAEIPGTGGLFAYLPDGTPFVTLFALEAPGKLNVRVVAVRAHEGVHVLRTLGYLPGARTDLSTPWGRLSSHADYLNVLANNSVRQFMTIVGHPHAARGSDIITMFDNYHEIYKAWKPTERLEIMGQEMVASMLELYVHGHLTDQDIAPIKDLVDQILSGETAKLTPVVGENRFSNALPKPAKSYLPGSEETPRVNTAGTHRLMLPFAEKWGDPRFDPDDRARALDRMREIAQMNVRKASWADLVQARTDLAEIAAQLYYYPPDLTSPEQVRQELGNRFSDEVSYYEYVNRMAPHMTPAEAETFMKNPPLYTYYSPPDDLRAFAKYGEQALKHLIAARRRGMDNLLAGYDLTEPKRFGGPVSTDKIANKMRSGFYFEAARKLADVPDDTFKQGGQAVINWLRQAGVSGAEIEHFNLGQFVAQKPARRGAFAQAIADRMFDFRRKTSFSNPERSPGDYGEDDKTRAARGPRIPGRGEYFERLMAFPKKLRGGGSFAPGHFESPHWEDQLRGTWASWRGSIRDLPELGKTIVGEEGQTDYMQGAGGQGDEWIGRRPRISQQEFMENKAQRGSYQKANDQMLSLVRQGLYYLDTPGEGYQRSIYLTDLAPSVRGNELPYPEWKAVLDRARDALRKAAPSESEFHYAASEYLDKAEALRRHETRFFDPGAKAKFADTQYTPATPMDETYVRTMARDLLLLAAQKNAHSIAISTSATTDRIQFNTHRSAAHFYDKQLKPALEKEVRRLTGDASFKLAEVVLPKAQGAPRNEKAYTVWAAKLPEGANARTRAEGMPLFNRFSKNAMEPFKPELDEHGLYSRALEAVKRLPQEKGTVAQFRSQIVQEGGSGTEKELQANGFDKAFPDPNAMTTRQAVEDVLRANRAALGTSVYADVSPKWTELAGRALNVLPERIADHAAELADRVLTPIAERQLARRQQAGNIVGDPRHEQWSTPGGIPGSYREVVTTLPRKGSFEDYLAAYRKKYPRSEESDESVRGIYDHGHEIPAEGHEQAYTSSHWPGVTNPLIHVRSKLFDNGDGTKTLVNDEQQNDAVENARKTGAMDPTALEKLTADLDKTKADLTATLKRADEFIQGHVLGNSIDGIADIPGEGSQVSSAMRWFDDYTTAKPNGSESAQARSLNQEVRQIWDRKNDLQNKVASAKAAALPEIYKPWMNTSDWVDLAWKQIFRQAALDPAVTRIAWAPGQVQVDRYPGLVTRNPSATVKVGKNGDRNIQLWDDQDRSVGFMIADNAGNVTYSDVDKYKGRRLTDIFGKDLGKEIAETDDDMFDVNTDLEYGGSGMRGFYGDFAEDGRYAPGIVGRRLLELTRALDPEAAKIEAGDLGPDQALIQKFAQTLRIDMAHLPHAEKAPLYDAFNAITLEGKSFDEARALTAKNKTSRQFFDEAAKALGLDKGTPRITYPSIPFTPKMREAVLRGLPMFGSVKRQGERLAAAMYRNDPPMPVTSLDDVKAALTKEFGFREVTIAKDRDGDLENELAAYRTIYTLRALSNLTGIPKGAFGRMANTQLSIDARSQFLTNVLGFHRARALFGLAPSQIHISKSTPLVIVHEFGHLLDAVAGKGRMFSHMASENFSGAVRTEFKWMSPQLREGFTELGRVLAGPDSMLVKVSKTLDRNGNRTKPYYAAPTEMFARAFEYYIRTKAAFWGLTGEGKNYFDKASGVPWTEGPASRPKQASLQTMPGFGQKRLIEDMAHDRPTEAAAIVNAFDKIFEGVRANVAAGKEARELLSDALSNPKALPDAVKADIQAAVDQARGIVQRIAGSGVEVVFESRIPASELNPDEDRETATEGLKAAGFAVGSSIGGFYETAPGTVSGRALIALATSDPNFDLATTAGHEAWHHVKEALATDAEKRILASPAEQARMRDYAAQEVGMKPGDPALQVLDPREVEAYAFQRFARESEAGAGSHAGAGLHIAIRRFFARLLEVLRRVLNALQGHGYGIHEDVFRAANEGEIADRDEIQRMAQANDDWFEAKKQELVGSVGRKVRAAASHGLPSDAVEAGSAAAGDTVEARKARAEAQGFDTSKVWYHGTYADFEAFRVSDQGLKGPGVYLDADPVRASQYANAKTFDGTTSRVYPVYVRGKLAPEHMTVAQAKTEGYTGAHSVSGALVVFDPKNIRSVNANFDPAKTNSSELLASAVPRQRLAAAIPRTPAEEAVLERIVPSNEDEKRFLTLDQIYTRLKDELNPIRILTEELAEGRTLTAEENPYILARLNRGNKARAEAFIKDGAYRFSDMAKIGPGLQEIMEPIQGDTAGLGMYAVSKRAIEKEKQGIETGVPIDEARQVVAEGAARYEQPFRQLVRYQRQLLAYLRDSGVLSNEAYVRMTDANKDYVPFYRLIENEKPSTGGGRGMKVRNPIKIMRGGAQQIIDPIESIVRNTFLYVDIAERNRALVALAELAESSSVGSEFMARIKPKMHPITVTEQEIAKFLASQGIEADPEAFTIFRPNAFRPAPDEIALFRNGKREVYKVDPEVGDAVNMMAPETIGLVTKMLRWPAKMLRFGATYAPEFVMRNPVRDQFSAFTFSRNGYVPVYDFLRGMGELWNEGERWARWLKSGGGNAVMVSINRDYINNNILRLREATAGEHAWHLISSPIDAIGAASEFMENATRMGEFLRSQEKGNSLFQSGFDTREVTLDFARMGSQAHAINQLVPFFNAQVEGVDRMARSFNENPGRFLLKTVLSISLISFLTWLANHKDKRWQEVPNWEKDFYWVWFTDNWQNITPEQADAVPDAYKRQIPDSSGGGGQWQQNKGHEYRMPKPFELGVLFGSVLERSLSAYFDEKPNAYKDLSSSVLSALLPNFIPQFAVPVLEQMTNYSFFTQRALVPRAQDEVLPGYQETPYTSETARAIGWAISKIAGDASSFSSPIVIDNYIHEWTGGLGQHVLNLVDAALHKSGVRPEPPQPTPTLADIPLIKAFAGRFPSQSAQSIQDFYDEYDQRKKGTGTINFLRKAGRTEAATELMGTTSQQKAEGIRKTLTTQSKTIRGIYKNPTMSPEDKRQLIDATYLQMIETAKIGLKIFKATEKRPGGAQPEEEPAEAE